MDITRKNSLPTDQGIFDCSKMGQGPDLFRENHCNLRKTVTAHTGSKVGLAALPGLANHQKAALKGPTATYIATSDLSSFCVLFRYPAPLNPKLYSEIKM